MNDEDVFDLIAVIIVTVLLFVAMISA